MVLLLQCLDLGLQLSNLTGQQTVFGCAEDWGWGSAGVCVSVRNEEKGCVYTYALHNCIMSFVEQHFCWPIRDVYRGGGGTGISPPPQLEFPPPPQNSII